MQRIPTPFSTAAAGGRLIRERHVHGSTVEAILNAKNSHDRYVGFKSYTFLSEEKESCTRASLSEDKFDAR